MTQPTREEIKPNIERSEARTDVKFAELRGDIKLVLQQFGSLSADLVAVKSELSTIRTENKSTRATVVNIGISVFVALIAVGALVATVWYNGTVVFDHLHPR